MWTEGDESLITESMREPLLWFQAQPTEWDSCIYPNESTFCCVRVISLGVGWIDCVNVLIIHKGGAVHINKPCRNCIFV